MVDGGEVGPGEGVFEFGLRSVVDKVFAQVELVRYVVGVDEADDGLQPFLREGRGASSGALIELAKVLAREQALFGKGGDAAAVVNVWHARARFALCRCFVPHVLQGQVNRGAQNGFPLMGVIGNAHSLAVQPCPGLGKAPRKVVVVA